MSISLFQDSPTYRDINNYTHRIRSPDISGPALTWHTSYWILDQYKHNFTNEEPSEFAKSELDRIIGSTLRALVIPNLGITDLKAIPRDEGKIILFKSLLREENYDTYAGTDRTKRQSDILNSENRAITFEFTSKQVRHRFRFEFHTEYFTITMIAEPRRDRFSESDKLDAGLSLIRYLIGSKGRLTPALQNALNFYFYESFWQELITFLEVRCSIGPMYDNEIFRHIFGDFRGLILSEKHVARLRQPTLEKDKLSYWGKEVADSLLGFITYNKRYEGTASYILDGRGLYITALGPQLGANYNRIRSPVTFVLCVQQSDKALGRSVVNNTQLGRVISTFLLLGTVRVAALKDLKKLRDAGVLLGKFEPLTRSVQEKFRLIATDRAPTIALQTVMDQIYDSFGKIGADLVPKNSDVVGSRNDLKSFEDITAPNGLQYRVERSRYYVSEFERNARYIRALRVDGYQTYMEFVERRLKSSYDYIDRLGRRFERAVTVLSLIEQNYLALRADKTERDLKEIGTKIGHIQTYGEVILLAVLVPYYFISTMHHIAHEPKQEARFFQVVIVSLLVMITAIRYVEWVRKGRPIYRGMLLPEEERLRQYALRRERRWSFILGQDLLGRKWTPAAVEASPHATLPTWLDRGRITMGNAIAKLASYVTVQAAVVFFVTMALWFLVFVPILKPSCPARVDHPAEPCSVDQGH